jgi:SagB-type dehydrogenase family enzyme
LSLEPVDRLLLAQDETALWELFHENSKLSRYERHPIYGVHLTDEAVVGVMTQLRTVKPFTDAPKVALPTQVPPSRQNFDDVLQSRTTARAFGPGAVELAQLAKVLFMSYAVTRTNEGTHFSRPFRIIPSGGALYPLELYVHAARVDGLDAGLYHYDPEDHSLDVLRVGDQTERISQFFFQPDLAVGAAAVVFVSAVFYRSEFKYGDRAYRFVLLEAGHLGQNALLCAQELGLAAAPIGGFLDRDVDRYLGFDGLSESTIYVVMIGRPGDLDGGPGPQPASGVDGTGPA